MVVRDRVGRKRYIAFEIVEGGDDLSRSRLSRAIARRQRRSDSSDARFDVIMIVRGRGIILTNHRNARGMIDLLNSFDLEDYGFSLRTLRTSGTILTLKRRYFSKSHAD